MAVLTPALRLRRWLILSQWQRWIFPTICSLPYLASVLWLMLRGQGWIAQVLLAPLLMGAVMALLTLCLARQEFRGRWRPR